MVGRTALDILLEEEAAQARAEGRVEVKRQPRRPALTGAEERARIVAWLRCDPLSRQFADKLERGDF
jgi:hypothetical protein